MDGRSGHRPQRQAWRSPSKMGRFLEETFRFIDHACWDPKYQPAIFGAPGVMCWYGHALQGFVAFFFPWYWLIILAYQGYDWWLTHDDIVANMKDYMWGFITATAAFVAWRTLSWCLAAARRNKPHDD